MPAKKPVTHEKHGDKRLDNYFWMKERDSAPVMEFLKSENARVEQVLGDTKALQEALIKEMRSKIKEDDSSVPVKDGEYYYYSRFETGREYPIYERKKGSLDAKAELLIDVNAAAKGYDYYSSTGPVVSDNHQVMAVAADKVGRRFYDISFKDLSSGQTLNDKIPATTGDMEWAKDNKTLFYVKQDPETLRAFQVFRYVLGSNKSELVYEEKDETFHLGLSVSKGGDYLFILSHATVSDEVRFLPAKDPMGQWQVIAPRERGHEYSVTWGGGDKLYILTNWKAKNFRLMETTLPSRRKEDWQEVVAHRQDVFLEDLDVYRDFMVLQERFKGLSRLTVQTRKDGKSFPVEFPDQSYVANLASLPEYDSSVFRYTYESLVRPPSVFDYEVAAKKATLRKEREVPGYDRTQYTSERLWATAKDGVKVPISILYRKDRPRQGGPALLYGYGSYGMSMEPWFSSGVLSLVDRGFAYAIAHIRGGSEMGRHWYEDGKLLKKMNTFTDFVASAEYLIQEKYTSADHLHIMGGSAGGLLMGAVINLRPDLFKGVVAAVPFVDVMTTMLDDSIPLTTSEYDEWGNPNEKKFYDYMRAYSPYDNVEAKNYPNILVTTGYHDSQVQYWEPAKWVAKMRDLKTDSNLLLFHTELSAGHSGASGRFERLKDMARNYAFYLKLEGIKR
ncbi:MAG: S9 family peptidase [Bdellovibrionales bacterium]